MGERQRKKGREEKQREIIRNDRVRETRKRYRKGDKVSERENEKISTTVNHSSVRIHSDSGSHIIAVLSLQSCNGFLSW